MIAAAAADAQTLNNAVESVIRTQRRNNIGSKRWKGSQPTLWQAFNPGTEQAAAARGVPQPHHHGPLRQVRPAAGQQARQQHRCAAGHVCHQPRPA